jgi:hypothetical protein
VKKEIPTGRLISGISSSIPISWLTFSRKNAAYLKNASRLRLRATAAKSSHFLYLLPGLALESNPAMAPGLTPESKLAPGLTPESKLALGATRRAAK